MKSVFARLMLQKKYILLILKVNIRDFFVQSAERSPDGKRKQRSAIRLDIRESVQESYSWSQFSKFFTETVLRSGCMEITS